MSLDAHLFLALLEGTVGALVLALTALGLSLVFGVMRIVNVAHGEFFMLGAVVTWYVSTITGSFLLALLAAPVVVGAVAILADRLVLRRIGYEPESTIVATIGLLYILQQLVLTTYGPYARPVARPDLLPRGLSLVRLLRVQAHRRRRGGRAARRDVDRALAHAPRAVHAGDAAGPGDGPGVRRAGEPRLHDGLRRGRRPGGRGRGPDRPGPAGPLPHGPGRAAAVLRGRDPRRAREPPRHAGGGAPRRAERRA